MDREVTGEMKCIGIDERFLQINACQKIGSMAGLPFVLHAAMQHDAGDRQPLFFSCRAQSDFSTDYSNS
jgi:hypothetical protein